MPRWEFHLTCGLFAAVLLGGVAIAGIADPSMEVSILRAKQVLPASIVGSLSLILGSVLPDVDGRGKIRWAIGPVVGALVIAPFSMASFLIDGLSGLYDYLTTEGAMTFTALTIGGYMALLVPMRHRGRLHDISSALAFGIVMSLLCIIAPGWGFQQSLAVGCFAFTGYAWHLALDGRLA